MVSHPLTGHWRLAWTHQRVNHVNLQHISYGLLPPTSVRVAKLHQLIYVERKSFVNILDLRFVDGHQATWTLEGVIQSYSPLTPTIPIDFHVEYQRGKLQSRSLMSRPEHWLAPYADREFILTSSAKTTTVMIGEESRIDKNANAELALLLRVD
jgi:hypothetical protein